MSSSTKIVVLKLKELVIACVLAVLAVILLVLSKKKKNVESHEERPLRAKRR